MERKIAIILATIALLCTIGVSFAASWYFSAEQGIHVNSYVVTMDPLPSNVANGTTLYISGTVTLAGEPMQFTTVSLYMNGTDTGITGITDSSGIYTISYDISQENGTLLTLKVGIFQ